jgi:molybdate transport system substrate-binding protein
MRTRITGISSMATRQVLAELARTYEERSGCEVAIESVGGVDAARRVASGEVFDVAVLASDALERLIAAGHVVAASKLDLARSAVGIAVGASASRLDISSEDAVRRAVLGARSIGLSTGPSGVQLARLFDRWGIAGQIRERMVQAPPGVPVGALVARGDIELGFQQLSELIGLEGIQVLGVLPPAIRIVSTFAAGVCANSTQADAARTMLEFMASPPCDEAKRRQGMEPM